MAIIFSHLCFLELVGILVSSRVTATCIGTGTSPFAAPVLFSSTPRNAPCLTRQGVDSAPLLVFFGDSVRAGVVECLGAAFSKVHVVGGTVQSRVAPSPGPHRPPGHRSPACAGSRFRRSWYAA
ncbi:hypothetical protein QBC39DRAFT_329925 [Podospora conica]|nr:hypothetical protein QBC39DRAFT_329925 [Schizothecium conicum]